MQLSALLVSQVAHAAPGAPQLDSERVLQVAAEQHPDGQDAASQTHSPPPHRWPTVHCAAAPHWHAPLALQPSARAASQATHEAPPTPHADSDRGLQPFPEQQPFGQLAAVQPLQLPLAHGWPEAQTWHADPPLPQA